MFVSLQLQDGYKQGLSGFTACPFPAELIQTSFRRFYANKPEQHHKPSHDTARPDGQNSKQIAKRRDQAVDRGSRQSKKNVQGIRKIDKKRRSGWEGRAGAADLRGADHPRATGRGNLLSCCPRSDKG